VGWQGRAAALGGGAVEEGLAGTGSGDVPAPRRCGSQMRLPLRSLAVPLSISVHAFARKRFRVHAPSDAETMAAWRSALVCHASADWMRASTPTVWLEGAARQRWLASFGGDAARLIFYCRSPAAL